MFIGTCGPYFFSAVIQCFGIWMFPLVLIPSGSASFKTVTEKSTIVSKDI